MSEIVTSDAQEAILKILEEVKPLAIEYYKQTKKPLGVTGEIAEYWAAKELGLQLAAARTPGYDAVRITPTGTEHIQIKGRAYEKGSRKNQRISKIKIDSACSHVLLVILDNATLEPLEMWEAPFAAVRERLQHPGSKSRNERGALGVSEFKSRCSARKVWPILGAPND